MPDIYVCANVSDFKALSPYLGTNNSETRKQDKLIIKKVTTLLQSAPRDN